MRTAAVLLLVLSIAGSTSAAAIDTTDSTRRIEPPTQPTTPNSPRSPVPPPPSNDTATFSPHPAEAYQPDDNNDDPIRAAQIKSSSRRRPMPWGGWGSQHPPRGVVKRSDEDLVDGMASRLNSGGVPQQKKEESSDDVEARRRMGGWKRGDDDGETEVELGELAEVELDDEGKLEAEVGKDRRGVVEADEDETEVEVDGVAEVEAEKGEGVDVEVGDTRRRGLPEAEVEVPGLAEVETEEGEIEVEIGQQEEKTRREKSVKRASDDVDDDDDDGDLDGEDPLSGDDDDEDENPSYMGITTWAGIIAGASVGAGLLAAGILAIVVKRRRSLSSRAERQALNAQARKEDDRRVWEEDDWHEDGEWGMGSRNGGDVEKGGLVVKVEDYRGKR